MLCVCVFISSSYDTTRYNNIRTQPKNAAFVMTVVFEEIKRNMAALNSEFSLIYFPLLAKGFGVALVAEFSGLPYDGPKTLKWTSKTDWKALKPTTTFGQLPLLRTKDGIQISQTTAIVNWIAKKQAKDY